MFSLFQTFENDVHLQEIAWYLLVGRDPLVFYDPPTFIVFWRKHETPVTTTSPLPTPCLKIPNISNIQMYMYVSRMSNLITTNFKKLVSYFSRQEIMFSISLISFTYF